MSRAFPQSDVSSLPNVQYLNMTLMMLLHVAANRDPARAAFVYDLNADDIALLRSISVEEIEALVANVDVCLFKPRPELLELVQSPAGLAGILASVRAARSRAPTSTALAA